MHRRSGRVKTAGIVIAAALFVVCILLAAAWRTIQGGTRDSITLPESTASSDAEQAPEPNEDLFVQIDRENVQTALDTMSRPEAYHQVLELTTIWEDETLLTTLELWQSGKAIRAQLTSSGQVKNILTDGEVTWVWFEGDATAAEIKPDASVGFDDLCGIPTYEMLTELDPEQIREAGFVTMDESSGLNCLYISVQDGAYEDRYWVDVSTQLIYRADSLENGAQTYQLRQNACMVISPSDTSLEAAFRLPDGTDVLPSAG